MVEGNVTLNFVNSEIIGVSIFTSLKTKFISSIEIALIKQFCLTNTRRILGLLTGSIPSAIYVFKTPSTF
uniref:Uncharacterized protein n=1 Tax=Trichuris muris TaxID=70415 RepID=A0A5S6R383_TRIMR